MTKNSWVEKYRPSNWDSIQGNNKAVKHIRQWVENWEIGDKPQLLVGEPGTGKTTTATVAAEMMDIPLNMVNLSDKRRTDELKQVARSTMSSPADDDHQLVLLDEIDNMYHSVKKKPLYDALRSPRNPIIITANDKYEVPDPVKRACKMHTFKLGVRSRKAKIKEIAKKEDIELQPSELNRLAQRPDLRSAINDLQNTIGGGSNIGSDDRTWSEGAFPAIEGLLGGDYDTWENSVSYTDDSFNDLGSALLWADENLSQEFRGLEGGVAYEMLANADFWLNRAWEKNEHRYQKYGWAMLSKVHETRLSKPFGGYIDVDFPKWFRHSEAKADGNTAEAQLYQALKGGERGYKFSASFYEFRQRYLPLLQDLPESERMELALAHSLNEDALEALNLDPDDFDDWREVESPQEGEGWSPDASSAADASW